MLEYVPCQRGQAAPLLRFLVLVAALLLVIFGDAYIWPLPCTENKHIWLVSIALIQIVAGSRGLWLLIDNMVNLNWFSMHAVYRNRLVRAFLARRGGVATRPAHPPAAGPDTRPTITRSSIRTTISVLAVSVTISEPGQGARLFPVINVTLNRTRGMDTARAERKADPFIITPLYCGAAVLEKMEDEPKKPYVATKDSAAVLEKTENESIPKGAYVATEDYAAGPESDKDSGPLDDRKGISLGTAMALSGAAISPNMGYNSSPFTAFLMTLFNVRLGAWLPNPGYHPPSCKLIGRPGPKFSEIIRRPSPKYAVPTLLRELTGQSDIKDEYVYLSDGGHFDNLGLYEMLRRRCRFIFAVDAGREFKVRIRRSWPCAAIGADRSWGTNRLHQAAEA